MLHRTALAALLVTTAMAGCAPEPPVVLSYQARHVQRLAPSNSMLGEACDGHDHTAGVRLGGNTLLKVQADLMAIENGTEVPAGRINAPASEAVSQMVRPLFAKTDGAPSCGGLALRTVVRTELGIRYLEWQLEYAPAPGDGGGTDPWMVSGRAMVDAERGIAGETAPFEVDGRQLVARIWAAPGPAWVAEQRQAKAKLAVQPGRFGRAMPDERPGQTLKDVTNPEYRQD